MVNSQTNETMQFQPSSTDDENISNCRPNNERDNADKPPLKRFKHLERVSNLLDEEAEDDDSDGLSQISKEEKEIDNYINAKINKDDMKLDSLVYWLRKETDFPNLANIACDVLAIPASTTPVERIFSTGGEATKGKRNHDKNLEWKI